MDTRQPKISILTPCCNSAQWLPATLASLYAQSFTDWELLLLDDGSTDATPRLLESHAGVRPDGGEVRIFSSPGRGVAEARNRLLELARGEYLLFLDSDDLLPPDALAYLLSLIEERGADVAEGRILCYPDGDDDKVMRGVTESREKPRVSTFDGRGAVESSLYQTLVSSSLSGKLFRRNLFDGIRFPVGRLYEDLYVFHRVAICAANYVCSSKVVYLYRQRSGSIIHTFNPRRLDVLDITEGIEAHMRSLSDEGLIRAACDRRLSAAFNMLGLLLNNTSALPAGDRERYIRHCREVIATHSSASLRNPRVRMLNRTAALLAIILPTPLLDRLLRRRYRS